MSEVLPFGWSRVSLSSISERIKQRNIVGNTNVLTISAIDGLVNQRSFFNKIVASENLSNYFLLKNGDFAYNKSYSHGYPVGAVRRLEKYDAGVLSPLYICFRLRCKNVDSDYVRYFFDSHFFIGEINQIAKEGVRNHGLLNIGVSDFFDISVVCPPFSEQKKIASLLSSVDDVIEKTRAQIDKLKNLKTGMMQELLTQGIGHTEFKDSPLGRIPVSWQVRTLGDLASLVTSGSRGWAEYYSESGPIFVRIGNLTREHINLRFEDTVHVALPDSAEGRRTQLKEGDVLISITADLGVIGVVNASLGEAYVNQHIALVRLKNPVFSRWVGHFLSLGSSQRQFIENNDAGAKAGLNLPTIKKVLVALPGDKEQRELVEIVDKIDASIVQKAKKLKQVIYLKKSLMQDLLTGKARVKVDSPETVAA